VDTEQRLVAAVTEAANALYGADVKPADVQVQRTRREFEGDLTVVVFPLTRASRKGPEETADALGRHLVQHSGLVHHFNVVKGFLNVSFSSAFWLEKLGEIVADERYGVYDPRPGHSRNVMVEYASPNTNKPLHLGHIRNVLLGWSVAEILRANGHAIRKVQVINDRGIHICKSMVAWQRFGNGETPESSGLKGDKLVGKYYVRFDQEYRKEVADMVAAGTTTGITAQFGEVKAETVTKEQAEKEAPILKEAQAMLRQWEANDPQVRQLWATMNGWVYDGFDVTYSALGIDFDQNYYESQTYLLGKEVVKEGVGKEVFKTAPDGSIWCDLTPDGLDQKIVQRSDGTAVYITQDIGTAIQRKHDWPQLNQLIYTVGNEQDYHFKVLFLILQKLGYAWAKDCYHLSYGMVDLPSGKMKSREGTVVDADDLIAEMIEAARQATAEKGKTEDMTPAEAEALYRMLALGALKYFILKVDPKKRMLFDPAESIDLQGNTGPFIQYTHARIRSVLRKAGSLGAVTSVSELHPKERAIIRLLAQYPLTVREAGTTYQPSTIANYAYEVAKEYNQFYHDLPILKEVDTNRRQLRLAISHQTATVIRSAMHLLGIQVPERM
jgi:arginyl-tRNA synthetase